MCGFCLVGELSRGDSLANGERFLTLEKNRNKNRWRFLTLKKGTDDETGEGSWLWLSLKRPIKIYFGIEELYLCEINRNFFLALQLHYLFRASKKKNSDIFLTPQ